jgi:hypothetical protein
VAGGAPLDRRDLLLTAGLLLIAILAIAVVQRPLEAENRRVKETTDVYALPPPREVVLLSLGYRSALADHLWAHVLVSQGLHTQEKRRFGNLIRLLDAINELEPTFREPYAMADALITFQASATPREEVLKAREIMERGAANRPLDAELHLVLGEFLAFIAPASYITDPAEQAAWRVDGARVLARAAELAGNDSHISWQALGGVGILSRAGERDAAIRFLQRTLAVTDDQELKARIQTQLDQLSGERRSAQRDDLFRRLDEGVWALRHRDLPFVARMEYMVLGPPRDPAYCAGPAHALEARCAPSWRAWEEREEAAAGR